MNRTLIVPLLIAAATVTHAEGGCPQGEYPQSGNGWRTCVPIPGAQSNARATPKVHWVDRYNAIASDLPMGILGTSVDQVSNGAAVTAAISDCEAKGGKQCRLDLAVRNGCIAMVVGDERRIVDMGDTQDDAEKIALRKCGKEDTNCVVYYSACSPPIRMDASSRRVP